MTAAKPIGSSHGYDLFETTSSEVTVWRGSQFTGSVFPAIVTHPERRWYARRVGVAAEPFDSRHQALAHLLGGCPDCACDPVLCHFDDTGRYCELINCGACLHGCPEGECDMLKEGHQ